MVSRKAIARPLAPPVPLREEPAGVLRDGVRLLHLHDFKPSKTKVEKVDIDTVAGDLRRLLE